MKKVLAIVLALVMCLSLSAAAFADGETGSVYYLNFKPEVDEAWKELAAKYTEETGVPVTVSTAASNTYEETLMSEISKSNPPLCSRSTAPWDWPTGRITASIWLTPTSPPS